MNLMEPITGLGGITRDAAKELRLYDRSRHWWLLCVSAATAAVSMLAAVASVIVVVVK